jgi:hypothetical protein
MEREIECVDGPSIHEELLSNLGRPRPAVLAVA